MNCNYDCDESPSLSSNDCLMKDVSPCSGVDGLSIFVNFSSCFNSRNFESIGIKCFDYCIQTKNELHLPRHCK